MLSLNEDFGSPSPILLRKGSYLAPNHQGHVKLRRDEAVLIGCPGDRQSVILGNDSTELSDLVSGCFIYSSVAELGTIHSVQKYLLDLLGNKSIKRLRQ